MKHGTTLLLSAGMMLASLSAVNAATPDALIQAHHLRCGNPSSMRSPLTTKRKSRFASSPRLCRIHSGRPAQNIRKWTLPYRHIPLRTHTRAIR